MLNRAIIQGRLVADPELKSTQSGVSVCSFRIACDRDFKNKDTGERETDFVNVVAWRSTAEYVSNYFSKGRMIIVSGRLQVRQYTDKDGNKRTATEIVAESAYFGDSKPAGGGSGSQANNYTSNPQNAPYGGSAGQQSGFTEMDDEEGLPF